MGLPASLESQISADSVGLNSLPKSNSAWAALLGESVNERLAGVEVVDPVGDEV